MRLPRDLQHKGPKFAILSSAATLAAATMLGGCQLKSFIDPGELSRGPAKHGDQLTVKIIDQLDPGTAELDPRFPRAEEPKADDLVAVPTDYRIGPGDVVDIAVTDLTQQGIETVNTRQVTDSGNVTLPLLKQPVHAEGLTEPELSQAITQEYKAENIITEAQVNATLRVKRNRTFNIRGAIEQPGEYEITQTDFRLLNALVQARDITRGQATAVDYIYVVRKVKYDLGHEGAPATGTSATPPSTQTGGRDPLAPQSRATQVAPTRTVKAVALMQNNAPPATAAPAAAQEAPTPANTAATVPSSTAGETEGRFIIVDGKPVQVGGNAAQAPAPAPTNTGTVPPRASATLTPDGGRTGFGGGRTAAAAGATTGTGTFAFNAPETEGETRVIRIPFEALRNGELKYNIVVRPQDMIIVPEPKVSVYYMGGHVGAPGAYNMIPGNKITLMDAVIAARMLDGIAIPARTDVIRRIGDQKMFVRVDLEKVFAGQQPDIYLKENDNVMVGTNAAAPFISAFRNAFRITYGFGFLYDRNFAAKHNNEGL